MMEWKLKGCPRCGGDLFIDRDLETWYAQCLQCSHQHEFSDRAEIEKQPVAVGADDS